MDSALELYSIARQSTKWIIRAAAIALYSSSAETHLLTSVNAMYILSAAYRCFDKSEMSIYTLDASLGIIY